MFLPTPNALTLPEGITPAGIGFEACNSGNNCNGNGCDSQSQGSDSSCGWSLVGILISLGMGAI